MRRSAYAIATLIFAFHVSFLLVANMPGDPIEIKAREFIIKYNMPYTQAYETAKSMYLLVPLNASLYEKYFFYLSHITRGDLGRSIVYDKPVVELIAESAPWTLLVAVPGILIGFVLGGLIGAFSGLRREKKTDAALLTLFTVLDSTPSYLFSLFFVFFLGVYLRLFPVYGTADPSLTPGFYPEYILSVARHAVLPTLSYAIPAMAGWYMVMRYTVVSVLGEDYVLFAQARGIPDRIIVRKYVARAGLLPMVAGLAIAFGLILGGALIIEQIYAYKGMGYLFLEGYNGHDYILLQGLFLTQIFLLTLANMVTDLLYPLLDPRVRFYE
ncbi:MAG: ABC transporter permease [Infirmifilum sp.]